MNFPPRISAVLERLEETRWKYYNLHRTAAEVIGIIARAAGARNVVEVGTANGYSAIILGAAVRPQGGRVVTIERDGEIAEEAKTNVAEAGLQDVVTVLSGSAYRILQDLRGPWDLAFIDGTKQEYVGYLERMLPKFSPKALLVADNLLSHADELADFHARVHAHPHLDATVLPVGTGLLVALYEHLPTTETPVEKRRATALRELITAAEAARPQPAAGRPR